LRHVDFTPSLPDSAREFAPGGCGRRQGPGLRVALSAVCLRETMMYAVIKTGGKQYRVAADDVLTIEKIAGEAGATVEFGEVLLLGGTDEPKVGTPALSGAKVVAEVVSQGRAAKVIAFKKRRRKNSRRKRGHRQHQTTVRIKEILAG
jgi:large subunit ribosomal protein L21